MESTATNISGLSESHPRILSYFKLSKFRLGALVVFSAVVTYFTVSQSFNLNHVIALVFGGFFITSSANGLNQILEREYDRLMDRTRNRPLVTGALTVSQAWIFCLIAGITGTVMLWVLASALCGILGFVSIILYAFVYTPLKQKTPYAVLAGAFPGALPTLIGGLAGATEMSDSVFLALLLFTIQFVWQFPHFWSLAWFNADDYARAGFQLLPSSKGKDEFSRFQILVYCIFLLCASVLPFAFGFTGLLSALVCVFCGFAMLMQAYNFYRVPTDQNAKKLFIVTLLYLPLVQVALMTRA